MSLAVVGYIVVLVIDLLVGASLVVWKCVYTESDTVNGEVGDECKLAVGGTVGSLAIWLLALLVCPFCVIKCELYDTVEKGKRLLKKIRPDKHRELYIQSEIYLPTTLSINKKGQPMSMNFESEHYSKQDVVPQGMMPHDTDATMFHPDVIYTFNEANNAVNGDKLTKYLTADDPGT